MATIYECDNCCSQERSHAWTKENGWHYPPGWYVGEGMELVCSKLCMVELTGRRMAIENPKRPRLTLVGGLRDMGGQPKPESRRHAPANRNRPGAPARAD